MLVCSQALLSNPCSRTEAPAGPMGRLRMARVWGCVYHIRGDIILLLCLMVAMEIASKWEKNNNNKKNWVLVKKKYYFQGWVSTSSSKVSILKLSPSLDAKF